MFKPSSTLLEHLAKAPSSMLTERPSCHWDPFPPQPRWHTLPSIGSIWIARANMEKTPHLPDSRGPLPKAETGKRQLIGTPTHGVTKAWQARILEDTTSLDGRMTKPFGGW